MFTSFDQLQPLSHQSILIHVGPLNLLGLAACQNHGASQHIEVLLTKQRNAERDRLQLQSNHRLQVTAITGVPTDDSATIRARRRERGSAATEKLDKTHLGVNPYSTDGTDLKIVTWQGMGEKRHTQKETGCICEQFFFQGNSSAAYKYLRFDKMLLEH